MASRILTHTTAALGGAALASAVFYGLISQGYFLPAPAPRGNLGGAKEAILDHLRKACGKEGLRGAFVDSVDERGDQLVVVGTLDEPDRQGPKLIEAATAALESNEAEWGRFFKRRPPAGEFGVYPLRSKLLPELRRLLEAGEPGVSGEKELEGLNDLVGRVWIEDVFSDAKGGVRVLGTVLASAGVKPEEARKNVQSVVAGFLARHPSPDKKAIEPIVGEDDFHVAVGVREGLAEVMKKRGGSVWGLAFDEAGTPVVRVLRSPKDQAGGLMADLMPALADKGLAQGGRKPTLVEVRADDKGLLAELRKKLAGDENRLGQQTRLDSVETEAGHNTLKVAFTGLSVHEGSAEKADAGEKKQETHAALRPILKRLLAAELKVNEANLTLDLEGVKHDPRLLVKTREMIQDEPKTSALRRVSLKGIRFDAGGRLVLESPSEPALVEKVRARAEKELLDAPPAGGGAEEFVAFFADPPPAETGIPKARRLLAKNAKDPELRYFRLDDVPPEDNNGKSYFTGVSIAPLKDKGLAKRITPALTEAGFKIQDRLLVATEAKLEKKKVQDDAYYLEAPNPVVAFQKRIEKAEGMEGVLLFDAYYQEEGKLRLLGILRDEKQRPLLQKLLEKPGEDVKALVLRAKDSTEEGLDLSGLEVASLDLKAECRKAFAASGEALLRHTRIDSVVWERGEKMGKAKVLIAGFCFHPNEDRADEFARTTKLKETIAKVVKGRIETLKKDPKLEHFPIPEDISYVLEDVKYADKTIAQGLKEGVVKDGPLQGAIVTGAAFDAGGKLRFTGLVVDEKQVKLLLALAAKQFPPTARKEEAGAEPALPFVPDVAGLKAYTNKELREAIQAALARDPAADVRRVRVDSASCEYKKEAPHALVLRASGIALGGPDEAHPARGPVSKAAAEYLGKLCPELPSLGEADLRLAKQKVSLAKFQEKVAESPPLDGTLLTDVGYDDKGNLLVTGISPDPAKHAERLPGAVAEGLDPIVLDREKSSRSLKVKLTPLTWKASAKTWPEMLDAIQEKLATDPARGDPSASQTRIDRAYFFHDGNPADAELRFAGLSLYAIRRDADAGRKKQFGMAMDKTADLLEEARFHDGYLTPLARTVEAEAKRLIAAPPFTSSVKKVSLRISPIAEAHQAANKALKGRKPNRRVQIDGFDFDAKGNLVPVVKFDASKEAGEVAAPAIRAAIEEADEKQPAHRRFLREGAAVIWPTPRPEVGGKAGAKSTPYERTLDEVRAKLADGGSGPVANSAWVEEMDLVYDGVKPAFFQPHGVLLSPAPRAVQSVEASLNDLGGAYKFSAKELKHVPDALKRLQAALADGRVDGVVFRSARYAAGGELALVLAVNEAAQREGVEARLKNDPSLFADVLARGKGYKVVPEAGLVKWPGLIENTTRSFLREDATPEGGALPLGRYTRLDRAALRLGETWDEVELHWEGVCIYPGPADADAIKKEARRRLTESAKSVVLSGATCEVKEVGKAGTTVETNPKYAWQSGVSGETLPANDGILFEDAWYDEGKLRVSVLIAKGTPAKEDAQKKAAFGQIARVKLDPRVLDAGGKNPTPEFSPRDLPKLLEQVQTRVRASDRQLDSRVRIDRGYFTYPAARGQVEFHVSGLLLQRTPTGATADDAARQKEVDKLIDIIKKVEAPKVGEWAGAVKLVPHLTPILDLARLLQSAIKTVRGLDGVCLLDARFDGNQLRLVGKWEKRRQENGLLELCREFIDRKRSGAIDPKTIRLDCDELDSGKVLAGLRGYAADSLGETIVDRLFFDEDGLVNVTAMSPRPAETQTLLAGRLRQLLDASAGFAGKARLSVEPGEEAVRFLEAKPAIAVAEIASILEALRAEVQWPAKAAGKGPDSKWDGMLITRCYYTPDRKFGVQGLCDGPAQRAAFAAHLDGLSARGPFRSPLAGGVESTRLRAAPLAPMLAHLRRRLSSEEDFDGLSLVGAAQDATGRLLLKVDLVGPLPPARQARAEKLVRTVVEKRVEWAERVGGGTGLVIGSRAEREPELATATIRRATADLALALSLCPPGGPKWRPAGIPPQDYFAVTVAQLDRARLHAPGDSTLWYLRAMADVLLDDDESAERDARRADRIEADSVNGKAMRMRRLGLTERIQGEARRLTDGMLRKARTVAPPLD